MNWGFTIHVLGGVSIMTTVKCISSGAERCSLLRFSPLVNSRRLNRNGIISVQGYQYQESGSIRFRPEVSSS